MIIRQRRVRKSSKFGSRWSHASSKRREHVASLYTTAAIQAFLGAFMLFLAYQCYLMMREKFADLVWYLKYCIPFFVLLIAVIVLRALVGNIRSGLAVYHDTRRPPRPPSRPYSAGTLTAASTARARSSGLLTGSDRELPTQM